MILGVLQAGGQAFESIVQALDVVVGAQGCRVAQAADQGDLILPAQGIEYNPWLAVCRLSLEIIAQHLYLIFGK